MFEAYVLMTLLGIGFIANRKWSVTSQDASQNFAEHGIKPLPRNEIPSMASVHESSHARHVLEMEARLAERRQRASLAPEKDHNVVNAAATGVPAKPKTYKSSLAGIEIPVEQFTHNNMLPFFGSSVKQNTDAASGRAALDYMTGESQFHVSKQETESFFKAAKDVTFVHGMTLPLDDMRSRIAEPRSRNNEFPIDKVTVGPGVGRGYTALPSDVYVDQRQYMMPKTVDDLRPASDPKQTFAGRVLPPQGIQLRVGDVGDVAKNRPETFRELSHGDLFKTTGAYTSERQRPAVDVKPTARPETSREYKGVAYYYNGAEVRSAVSEGHRTALDAFQLGAAVDYNGKTSDYGKGAIQVYSNEREVTTVNTRSGNLSTAVKAIAAPLLDVLKPSKKEYTVQNPREYGHLTGPVKIVVYDPNDIARTTLKETLLAQAGAANLKAQRMAGVVFDPNDASRTTGRQTIRPMDSELNLSGGRAAGKVYDPNEVAKTTVKETTVDQTRSGNIEGLEGLAGGYLSADYTAPATQKETLSANSYVGVSDANWLGNGGYTVANVEAKRTQKEALSDNDYFGAAGAQDEKRSKSYDDAYNATVNETRELTLSGRDPTQTSVKFASGQDAMNVQHRKVQTNDGPYVAVERVYSVPPGEQLAGVTKIRQAYHDDGRSLDTTHLAALQTNPFAININPVHIADDAESFQGDE